MSTLYREPVTLDTEGRAIWPFKYINSQQTPESKALEADKGQHRPTEFDLNQFEDALL